MKIILGALPMTALLAGCVSLSDKQTSRFDRMSCSQLAVAYEYEDKGQRKAETSSAINSVSGLLTKGKESDRAELDSFADDLDADEHRAAKDYIRQRERLLDC